MMLWSILGLFCLFHFVRAQNSASDAYLGPNSGSGIRLSSSKDLISLNETCSNYNCEYYEVKSSSKYDAYNCLTTFCYTITIPKGGFDIEHLDFLGISYKQNVFSSNVSFWSHLPFGHLRNTLRQMAGSTKSLCFVLPGKYLTTTSSLILNMGLFSCQKSVHVPGISADCENDCVLDTNFGNAVCEGCPAKCQPGQGPSATGIETCTLRVKTPAKGQGKPCSALTTRRCTRPCPVDCQSSGPFWRQCSADCDSPTTTVTGYYITTPELNGGSKCKLTETTVTSMCSLRASASLKSCPIDCIYSGIPTVSCGTLCSPGEVGTKTATYTYPITLTPAAPGGAPCPTLTTTCKCTDCILGPTPTSINKCDAVCSAFDGSYATGYETHIYPVARPTSSNGHCITESLQICSKTCPCKFSASSSIGSCIPTSTITSTLPWVVTGFQAWTAIAFDQKCNTVVDLPCSTVLKPVDCTIYSECGGCDCMRNTDTPYTLTDTQKCRYTTIRPDANGGRPCPSQPVSIPCTKSCPGCEYLPPACGCEYTQTNPSSGKSIEYVGYKTCISELSTTLGYASGLHSLFGASSCDAFKTMEYSDIACSTKVAENQCLYTLSGCSAIPTYTSTLTTQVPWTGYGFNLCTFVDNRPHISRPKTCSSTISTVSISKTFKPINCMTTSVCLNPPMDCSTLPSGNIARTGSCSVLTLTTSKYGGASCPPAVTSTFVTKTTCAPPVPTSTACFELASEYNAVFFGSINASFTSVEGRLAIQYNAFLQSVNIGFKISYPVPFCDVYPSNALFVGGDLVHVGRVWNGNVKVYGQCSNGTLTSCSLLCNLNKCLCAPNGFDFELLQTQITRFQILVASLTTTVHINVTSVGGPIWTWSGNETEVITLSTNATGHVLNLPTSFRGTLHPKASILLNILGKYPVVKGLEFPFLKEYASRIVYNFPNATSITLLDFNVYGTLLARQAKVQGISTIFGQIFANSWEMYYGVSLVIKWVKYIGFCLFY